MIDFDVLLARLGAFGAYQIIVFASLVYFQVPGGMSAIAPVFISYVPVYRCRTIFDDPKLYNLTNDEILDLTTSVDENGDPEDGCVRYNYNVTECAVAGDLSCVNTTIGVAACDNGYYYDDSLFTETTATEFDLICDRSVLNSLTSSMYMVGAVVGALLFGNISDLFGRKLTRATAGIGLLISMLGTAYSNAVWLFIFWRFLTAFFISGCHIGIFSHLLEIVGKEWRTFVGIGYQSVFAIGYMLWSGVAYLYRDWHQMQLGSLVLSLPFAIIVLVVPESPRWLFVNGRDKKGKKVTSYLERLNKVELTEDDWNEAEKSGSEKEVESKNAVKYSTLELFKHPKLRLVTLNLGWNWAVNSFVYYGISLNAGSLAGNIFLNNIYSGILEMASYITCILVMDRVGRRLLLTLTLTGSGVALLSSTIVNEYAGDDSTLITLGLAFAFTGKALISGSFVVMGNFGGELMPTVLRSNGIGFGSMCSRFGSVISPFVIGLQYTTSWLPNVIFGSVAVIGGLSSLTFRDTTGIEMLETIEEAEMFYAGKLPQKYHTEEMYHTEAVVEEEYADVTVL